MKTHKISKDLTVKSKGKTVVVYSNKLNINIAALYNIKSKDIEFAISVLTFLYLNTEL